MRASNLLLVLLFSLGLIYAGCGKSEDKSDTGGTSTTEQAESAGEKVGEAVEGVVEKSEEMHEAQLEELRKKAPEEIATELWNLIQTEQYRQWKEMPIQELYEGDTDKKKIINRTYVNSLAHEALQRNSTNLPPGSILVKDKYDDQDQLLKVSAMINLGGNGTDDISWFAAQFSPDGKLLKSRQLGPGAESAR